MNVRDLIEYLSQQDPEAEVHFVYPSGGSTLVAPAVDYVEEGRVTYSAYHRMMRVLDAQHWDQDDEEYDKANVVVLLRS